MPTIYSRCRSNITVCNLDLMPFWRLHLGVTGWTDTQLALGLMVYSYLGAGSTPAAVAKVPIRLIQGVSADNQAAAKRVVDKLLTQGTVDGDVERAREAWRMFLNSEGINEKMVDEQAGEAEEIIRAYWKLQEWAVGRCRGDVVAEVPSTKYRIEAYGNGPAAKAPKAPSAKPDTVRMRIDEHGNKVVEEPVSESSREEPSSPADGGDELQVPPVPSFD